MDPESPANEIEEFALITPPESESLRASPSISSCSVAASNESFSGVTLPSASIEVVMPLSMTEMTFCALTLIAPLPV